MNIYKTIHDWHRYRAQRVNVSLGFVPTLGNLHAGHLSLCTRSQSENDQTVVSIFVNPAQFDRPEDFEHYPRTLEADLELLQKQNIDAVFIPAPEEIYEDSYQIQIHENNISAVLEGEYRPGHFDGVLTVVLKLLNLVTPTSVYFGEKDFQQLLLIKKMVHSLFLPVKIVACPTVRTETGLALSSRNTRLNETQLAQAAHFPRLLQSSLAPEAIAEALRDLGFRVDYIAQRWQRRLGAVWLGEVRLIDNFPIG